jgi:ABC-type transporter Mla MlaB component
MVLKIERVSIGERELLRMSGDLNADQLEELKREIKGNEPRLSLDLGEISLVDVDAVRFLGTCETRGIDLIHCPSYVREWINRERKS